MTRIKHYLFNSVSILLFLSTISIAQDYQYLSPVPGSKFNSLNTNIILRTGVKLNPSNLSSSLFKVNGLKSGSHKGEVILSDDGMTIIFAPSDNFLPAEIVRVEIKKGLTDITGKSIPSKIFQFTTTMLDEPIIEEGQFFHEQNLIPAKMRFANEDIPADFPQFVVNQSAETAPGVLIGGSKSDNENVGAYSIIMNNDGSIIHWEPNYGVSFDLQPNGLISYAKALGPKHQYHYYLMDRDFVTVDSFQMGNGYIADSHDFYLMENGHALMFAYDTQVIDMSQLVEGGNPEAKVTGSIVQEIDANKNVIFQWRSWDYIPITDSYTKITKAKFGYDHVNSMTLDYDGHILISARNTSDIIKISRETGEVIWRLGGKQNDFTFIGEHEENAPDYFLLQHSIRRWPNGNITIFDNGADKDHTDRTYSRAVEYQLDEVNMTATMVWEYRNNPDILALTGGTVQRLPNGNTLISWGGAIADGAPTVTEVLPDGTVLYELSYTELDVKGGFTRQLWDAGDIAQEVMITEIDEGNTYDFVDGDVQTGTSMVINSFTGDPYNEVIVTKTDFAPVAPQFPGKPPLVYPVRIAAETRFITAITTIVSFDIDFLNITNPEDITIYFREFPGQGLFVPLATDYNFVTHKLRAIVNTLGEFVFGYTDLTSQINAPLLLEPGDGASVNQTLPVEFSWTPVGYYNSFDLQAASDELFQNIIIDETNITGTSFTTDAPLNILTTYYWHVKTNYDARSSDWSATQSFNTTDQFITLLTPNGGEQWHVGLEYYIQWDDNIDEDVTLALLKNDAHVMDIATTNSDSYYSWEVDLALEPADDYSIKITSVNDEALFDISDNVFSIIDTVTSTFDDEITPQEYSLDQNYPNPFNPATTISYTLAEAAATTLRIYDLLGNEIQTLVNAYKPAGNHQVIFDASHLPSSIYFYTLTSGQYSFTKKMLLLK